MLLFFQYQHQEYHYLFVHSLEIQLVQETHLVMLSILIEDELMELNLEMYLSSTHLLIEEQGRELLQTLLIRLES